MADFFRLSAPDLLQRATTLFTGIRDTPDILDALAEFQVEADDEVKRGLALVEEVRARIGSQTAEAGEAVAATDFAVETLATFEARYRRDRKILRAHHGPGADVPGLVGEVPDGDAEMVAQGDALYRALAASPALYDGVRGMSKEVVAAGLARVEAAREAEAAQSREAGESQHATSLRQDAEARLRALADEVADVCEIALDDQPQRREVVGLFERGSA